MAAKKGKLESRGAHDRSRIDLRRVVDNVSDAIIATDVNQRITYWNRGAAALYGVSRSAALGKKLEEVYQYKWLKPGDEQAAYDALARAGAWRGENIHVKGNGEEVHVESTLQALKDSAGEPAGMVAVVRDITERKKAEEQLSYLASFPQLNPNPVIELNREGEVTYLNRSARRLFPDMEVGTNVLGHRLLANVAPMLQSRGQEKQEPLIGEGAMGDKWYHLSLFLLPDRTRVYAYDITKRKKAEEALRKAHDELEMGVQERTRELSESEERFAMVFRSSPAAMRLVDFETFRTVDVNESFLRLTGYSREETIGHTSIELGLFKEEPSAHLERRRILSEKGRFADQPMTVLTRSGEERTCLMSSEVVVLNNRRHSLSVLADITELKRAEAAREAEHQDRLRAYEKLSQIGRLSGSIAHELRNPLATIDSSVVLLKLKLKDADDVVNKHLGRIQAAVGRSLVAIQTLLEEARIKEPLLTTHDLRELAAEIVQGCQVPAGVKVVKDFPDGAVWVGADKEQLRLAFENIVKNAVEAMNRKGTLTITIDPPGKLATLTFRDSGPGIAPEHIDRVFEPLFTTKATGVGFGLPNARMIIGKHGGTIEVRSEVGKGAAFIICLPRRANGEKG